MKRYYAYYKLKNIFCDSIEEGQEFLLSSSILDNAKDKNTKSFHSFILNDSNYGSNYGIIDLYYAIPYGTMKDIKSGIAKIIDIKSNVIFISRNLLSALENKMFFREAVTYVNSIFSGSTSFNAKYLVEKIKNDNSLVSKDIIYHLHEGESEAKSFAIGLTSEFKQYFLFNTNNEFSMPSNFHKRYGLAKWHSCFINLNSNINNWEECISFDSETRESIIHKMVKWNSNHNERFSEYEINQIKYYVMPKLTIFGAEAIAYSNFYSMIPNEDLSALADVNNNPKSIEWYYNIHEREFAKSLTIDVGLKIIRNTGKMDVPIISELLYKYKKIKACMNMSDIDKLIESYLGKEITVKYIIYDEEKDIAVKKAIEKLFINEED